MRIYDEAAAFLGLSGSIMSPLAYKKNCVLVYYYFWYALLIGIQMICAVICEGGLYMFLS